MTPKQALGWVVVVLWIIGILGVVIPYAITSNLSSTIAGWLFILFAVATTVLLKKIR